MIQVHVDRDACHSARACVRRAPGTFSIDAERESAIREAAAACPFFAITVKEMPS